MNSYLQIGVGLLPGTVAAVFLLIKRRAFQPQKLAVSLLLMLGCGTALFFGGRELFQNAPWSARLSQKEWMAFANALVREGALAEAEEVMEQYSEEYGYDADCRLLNARLSLLEEDYASAYGLYGYLSANTDVIAGDAEEVLFAAEKALCTQTDFAMADYLKSIGENPEEYGYSEAAYAEAKAAAQKSVEDIREAVYAAIEDRYSISDAAGDCAETVAKLSAPSEELLGTERDTTGRYRRRFTAIEEDGAGYLTLECVKKARLKAYILAGDYAEITGGLDDDSSYHELMLAAELYMNGRVAQEDFSGSYREVDASDAAAVKAQIEGIYEKEQEGLSVQDRKRLRARADAVDAQLEDAALVTVKERLTAAADTKAGTDGSKVCLELARIEDYFGNETAADAWLSQAIYSSQDCEDDSYAAAMGQMLAVMEDGGDNAENIKNVSSYVDTVLEHSLTVDVEQLVAPQYQLSASAAQADSENRTPADFAQTAVDYVSRVKSAVSIGRIDTGEFEKITARVQIDSDYLTQPDELEDAIRVYDCGAEITEFSLRKLTYTGTNIMLVCDVSGSMDGSIQDLRDAVVTFIKDKNPDEMCSVVTFSSAIVEAMAFGTPDESLIAFAEGMSANGGTDMFSAVVNCLGSFSADDGANNVLILMTDGQDNSPRTRAEMEEQIGALALEKGISVYCMGLGGDVDTLYLNAIADSGNGAFVYVSDSASLTAFYDMLHAQLNSCYELTYTAQDTVTRSGRTLEVVLPEENARDTKTYSLDGAAEEENGLGISQELSIAGMSPRYLYKGLQDVEVNLKGTGFQKESSITVKFNGNMDYTLKASYVDAETYSVTIPSSIAVGSYDVEVTIDGRKKILQNGFSVIVQGDEKKTAFGPYVFTSAEKLVNSDGSCTLRGLVTMNGWLHFKGDVRLTGDLEAGGSIEVSDYGGSYVEFDAATAEGYGSVLAERGVSLDIPALYHFTLYNDPAHLYDYENYLVDDIATGVLSVYQLIKFDNLTIRLYPDSIGLYNAEGTAILPGIKKLFDMKEETEKAFTFTFENIKITNQNVGVKCEFKLANDDDKKTFQALKGKFMNSPVYFNGHVSAKIDTLKNEYSLGGMIRFAFLAEESGLGAEVSWKQATLQEETSGAAVKKLVADSVEIQAELGTPVKLPTAIPIELTKFSVSVSDLKDCVESGSFSGAVLTGKVTLVSGNLEEYAPKIASFIGVKHILEMPDTSVSLRISPFRMEAAAELKFLEKITLANADVSIGTFDYTNALLNLDGVEVSGVSAGLKVGLTWDSENERVAVQITGAGELDAHSRFVGTVYEGVSKFDVNWWLFNFESEKEMTSALGFYTTHSGRVQFVLTGKYQDSKGKVKGFFYYIDDTGAHSSKSGTLS